MDYGIRSWGVYSPGKSKSVLSELVCPGSGSGRPPVMAPDGPDHSRLALDHPGGAGLTLAVAIGRDGEP